MAYMSDTRRRRGPRRRGRGIVRDLMSSKTSLGRRGTELAVARTDMRLRCLDILKRKRSLCRHLIPLNAISSVLNCRKTIEPSHYHQCGKSLTSVDVWSRTGHRRSDHPGASLASGAPWPSKEKPKTGPTPDVGAFGETVKFLGVSPGRSRCIIQGQDDGEITSILCMLQAFVPQP